MRNVFFLAPIGWGMAYVKRWALVQYFLQIDWWERFLLKQAASQPRQGNPSSATFPKYIVHLLKHKGLVNGGSCPPTVAKLQPQI